jgi:hypothetical protein
MGASGWDYVTPYTGGVEDSLRALHAEEFEKLYGDGGTYGSIDELWADDEFMGEEGTHSILDIQRVVHTTAPPNEHVLEDYGTLRPLPPDRVVHHFGTDRPTPDLFRDVYARARQSLWPPRDREQTLIDECAMRWTGLYVLLYTGDRPTHLGVFGYSGD